MLSHLYFFRPGEEARMLARCQFVLTRDGECGVGLTYPIKGFPWRRNPNKSYEFQIAPEKTEELFTEIRSIKIHYPKECLANSELWSDQSEKANGITRDQATNTLCYTLAIYKLDGETEEYFSMRENSQALLKSKIFRTVTDFISPYETL